MTATAVEPPGVGPSAEGARPEDRPGPGGASLRRWADELGAGMVEASWLVALIAVPVYFNIYSWRSFEPDKAGLLTILAAVAGAAWAARSLAGGEIWSRASRTGPASAGARWLLAGAAAFLAATVLATVLSVSPARSLHGSFFRQQGLVTLLSLVVLALSVVAHLRRAEQWRRAVLAVALGSAPVSAFALVQRLGLDTLVPPDDSLRVSSTLGNPIFLGAYLALALLVTVAGLPRPAERARLRRAALAAVAALQLAALLLSQSRGPLLGLCAGALALALAWVLRARESGAAGGRRSRLFGILAGAVAVAALVLLALASVPGSPLAPLREVGTVGRLAAAFDPEAPTARVRLLIWRGVEELLTAAPPLGDPDGGADPLHAARPIVGYGPECFDLAFNRVLPGELGTVESRLAIPDRAHCLPLDLLVTTGALGLGTWLLLATAALSLSGVMAVHGLPSDRAPFAILLAGLGGAAAVAAAAVVGGRAELAGAVAPPGLLVGAGAALVLSRRGGGSGAAAVASPGASIGLAAFAALACFLVESSVGIPVTATRLLLWFLLACLCAAGLGRLDPAPSPAPEPRAARRTSGEGLVEALLAGTALAVITFSVMDRTAGAALGAVVGSLDGSLREGLRAAGSAPATIGLSAAGVALVLLAGGTGSGAGFWRRGAAAALPAVAVGALKSLRIAEVERMRRDGAELELLVTAVTGHTGLLVGALVALVLALGAVLARRGRPRQRPAPAPARVAVLVVTAAFVAAAAALAARHALEPVRADTLAKHAAAALDRGQPLSALRLLARASWIAPDEPALLTLVARATVLASRAPSSTAARRRAVDAAVAALQRAAATQPLDPDHRVNLGRVLTIAADGESPPARADLLARAEREYSRGVDLRPGSVVFRAERAGVLVRLGRLEDAAAELRVALEADPGFPAGALMLAGLERVQAVTALRSGETERAMAHLAAALDALAGLLEHGAGEVDAELAITTAFARLARFSEVTPALEGLVDGGEPAEVHEILALLHLGAGRDARALEEAETAVRMAGPPARPRAEAVLELVRAAALRPPPGTADRP